MSLEINLNKQIENIQTILSQPYLSVNDCSRLIIDLSELAEKKGKSKYPKLIFYRNLSVHYGLDRGNTSSTLKKIEEQFDIPESEQSTNDLIAELFSVTKLQNEVLSFQDEIPKMM